MNEKILIIDDDVDILDAMRFLLEDNGYRVDTMDNGKYAESLIHKKKDLPDLIILDILLSGKDGRKICKKLKSQNSTKNIPIIMISAHPNAEKSVKDACANDFLPKPFESEVLLKKIESYL